MIPCLGVGHWGGSSDFWVHAPGVLQSLANSRIYSSFVISILFFCSGIRAQG